MTIHLVASGRIEMTGTCPAEDAEILLQYLLADPGSSVDWRACEEAHAAVVQVLLAAGTIPAGRPASSFLRDMVAPSLVGRR